MKNTNALTIVTRNNATLDTNTMIYWSEIFARKAVKTVCYHRVKNETETNNAWNKRQDDMIVGQLRKEMEDIEHECYIAIWTLYKSGLCTNETELYRYRRYVYRVANTYITKQKRYGSRTNTRFTSTDGNGNDFTVNDRYIDSRIKETEKSDVLEVLFKICDGDISARTDRQLIKAVLVGMASGKHNTDIAKLFSIDEKQVRRVRKSVQDALHTPAVYEYLHMIIHDDYID